MPLHSTGMAAEGIMHDTPIHTGYLLQIVRLSGFRVLGGYLFLEKERKKESEKKKTHNQSEERGEGGCGELYGCLALKYDDTLAAKPLNRSTLDKHFVSQKHHHETVPRCLIHKNQTFEIRSSSF